jgi:hypothetical protein
LTMNSTASLSLSPVTVQTEDHFRKANKTYQCIVTVFLRPLSPCDLVCAESKLAARAKHHFVQVRYATNATAPTGRLTYAVPITSDVVWRGHSVFHNLSSQIIAQRISHACCINGSFPLHQVGCNPTGSDCQRRVLEAVREQDRQARMPVWVR